VFAVFGFLRCDGCGLALGLPLFLCVGHSSFEVEIGNGCICRGWVGMGVWLLDGPVVGACAGSDGTRVAMGSWFSCATVDLAGGLNLSLI